MADTGIDQIREPFGALLDIGWKTAHSVSIDYQSLLRAENQGRCLETRWY